MGENSEEEMIEHELRGNTLRVYWYMIQENSFIGVRELQRALKMSSPSVAAHHLNKLVKLHLVEKRDDNTYELVRIVKVGVLRNFVGYRGHLLPRYTFFAIFFTIFTVVYAYMTSFLWVTYFDRYIALALGTLASLFGWFETYRLWKLKLL